MWRWQAILRSGFAMAVLWGLGLGSANATLVRGSIDPTFGGSGTLAGIYWTANISFNVDSSCLAAATQDISCAITGLTATGTVDDGTDGTVPVNYLATPMSPPSSVDLAVDASHNVIGIGTMPIGFGTVTFPALSEVANLWVQFYLPVFNGDGVITTASQGDLIATLCTPELDYSLTFLDDWRCSSSGTCTPSTDPTTGDTSVRHDATIVTVPEPGSLWLIFAALAVMLPLVLQQKPGRAIIG